MSGALYRLASTQDRQAGSLPWQGFTHASRIMTPEGEKAVASQRPGDVVMLMCRPRPAKILRVTEMVVDLARHSEAAPVMIMEGAIADGSPARTCEVAPDTLLEFRDVLIPAHALVNGVSVVRVAATGRVRYLQLETAEHEIAVVDGLRVASLLASTAPCRPIGSTLAIARAWTQVSQRVGHMQESDFRARSDMNGRLHSAPFARLAGGA